MLPDDQLSLNLIIWFLLLILSHTAKNPRIRTYNLCSQPRLVLNRYGNHMKMPSSVGVPEISGKYPK